MSQVPQIHNKLDMKPTKLQSVKSPQSPGYVGIGDEHIHIRTRRTMAFLTFLIFILCCTLFAYYCIGPYHDTLLMSYVRLNEGNSFYAAHLYQPEQLHLSLGSDSSELFVTWSTKREVSTKLQYGRVGNDYNIVDQKSIAGDQTEWFAEDTKLGVSSKRHMNTYRAKMTGLEDGAKYVYRVVAYAPNDMTFFSTSYTFTAKDLANASQIKMAIYGDLGLINGQSIPRLIKDVDEQKYDLIIHNGDFAYDLNTNHGEYGDRFMRDIEPIAARVPYQTSVGNHEVAANFTHYNQRFTMINSGGHYNGQMNNFFYSFNAGPIHFIAISTEFYYFLDYVGFESLHRQYMWLLDDLKMAASPQERQERPWIIVFGHRPMYCSSVDHDDCTKNSSLIRHGLPFLGTYALEKVFYDFGVDVLLFAHEHQYERFLPIYDGEVLNGTDPSNPYDNARAPVHIISGSAGCQERLDPFEGKPVHGSAKRVVDYGYTRLMASRCSLRFEQISDDCHGCMADKFVVTKNKQNFPVDSKQVYDCDQAFEGKPSHDSWWYDGTRDCTTNCQKY